MCERRLSQDVLDYDRSNDSPLTNVRLMISLFSPRHFYQFHFGAIRAIAFALARIIEDDLQSLRRMSSLIRNEFEDIPRERFERESVLYRILKIYRKASSDA